MSTISAAAIAQMLVAASGNTIRRIVAVRLTAIAERRTGLEALLEVIPYRTGSELRNETLVDKAAISGATTGWVIAVGLVIEVVLAIAATVAGSAIVVALVTEAGLVTEAIAVVLVIVVVLVIEVESVIVAV